MVEGIAADAVTVVAVQLVRGHVRLVGDGSSGDCWVVVVGGAVVGVSDGWSVDSSACSPGVGQMSLGSPSLAWTQST